MNRSMFILTAALLLLMGAAEVSAQPGRGGRMGWERLEKYRKLRMIEALNLNEEEAARFTAKFNEHREIMQGLMDQRSGVIDTLEGLLKSKVEMKEFAKPFAELEENDQKMFNERRRFQTDLKSLLDAEQIARFQVFERNFNRDLRDAMQDMRRDRWRR